MVFSSTVSKSIVMGSRKVKFGTYTGTGVTTGDVATGLKVVEVFVPIAGGSSVVADATTVNETLPLKNGGAVTIIFTSGTSGFWMAIGK